jgi:hypothetical protein
MYSLTRANTFRRRWWVKALGRKDSEMKMCIRGGEGLLVRVVTLRLAPEDIEVVDGLARLYGSRA